MSVAYFCVFALQYFLQPKLAKEPVPQQLEGITKEILVPLVSVLHRLIDKVIVFSLCFLVLHLPITLCKIYLLFGSQWVFLSGMVNQALTTHGWGELELEKTIHIICKCLYFSVSHTFSLYCRYTKFPELLLYVWVIEIFHWLLNVIYHNSFHIHVVLSTVIVLLRMFSVVGEVPYVICFVTSARFLLSRYDQNSGLLEFWLECYSFWWVLDKVESWKKKFAPLWHTCQQT